jgi:hypothetical protein
MPHVPFFPIEGFTPQQIVRNARDRALNQPMRYIRVPIDMRIRLRFF